MPPLLRCDAAQCHGTVEGSSDTQPVRCSGGLSFSMQQRPHHMDENWQEHTTESVLKQEPSSGCPRSSDRLPKDVNSSNSRNSAERENHGMKEGRERKGEKRKLHTKTHRLREQVSTVASGRAIQKKCVRYDPRWGFHAQNSFLTASIQKRETRRWTCWQEKCLWPSPCPTHTEWNEKSNKGSAGWKLISSWAISTFITCDVISKQAECWGECIFKCNLCVNDTLLCKQKRFSEDWNNCIEDWGYKNMTTITLGHRLQGSHFLNRPGIGRDSGNKSLKPLRHWGKETSPFDKFKRHFSKVN